MGDFCACPSFPEIVFALIGFGNLIIKEFVGSKINYWVL